MKPQLLFSILSDIDTPLVKEFEERGYHKTGYHIRDFDRVPPLSVQNHAIDFYQNLSKKQRKNLNQDELLYFLYLVSTAEFRGSQFYSHGKKSKKARIDLYKRLELAPEMLEQQVKIADSLHAFIQNDPEIRSSLNKWQFLKRQTRFDILERINQHYSDLLEMPAPSLGYTGEYWNDSGSYTDAWRAVWVNSSDSIIPGMCRAAHLQINTLIHEVTHAYQAHWAEKAATPDNLMSKDLRKMGVLFAINNHYYHQPWTSLKAYYQQPIERHANFLGNYIEKQIFYHPFKKFFAALSKGADNQPSQNHKPKM